METAQPMADIEGGPEPSKTVEAADRATHYAKPSVASESNSEAESNLRRKSAADLRRKVAAESLNGQGVTEPPAGRKPTHVGWSHPLVSTTQDYGSRENDVSNSSFRSQASTLVTRPIARPYRPLSPSPRPPLPGEATPKFQKPSIIIAPKSEDRGRPGHTNHSLSERDQPDEASSGDSEDSSDYASSVRVRSGDGAPRILARGLRREPILFSRSHRPRSNTLGYRHDNRQHVPPTVSSDDETWQRRPHYPAHPGYYSNIPLHLPETVGRPISYAPPYNYGDENFPYYAPRPTDGVVLPQHPMQLPAHHPHYSMESQGMHAHAGPLKPPSPKPEPSLASILDKLILARDADPIKVLEDYLEGLRGTKQKELLDAHRVLSWIDRRTRDEPIQKLDVNSFRVHDNESEVSHENHSASIVNSDASASEPARSELATHRVSFEDQGSASIVRTQDRLLERMVDISTTSSSHASIDCIPSTPISNICIQAGVHPGDFGSDEGVLNEAPSVVVENAITQERNMLRQELDSLKQQLKHKNRGWFAFSMSAAFNRWRKQFRKGPPPGTQRLEWTCECGEDMVADLPVASGDEYREMLDFLTKPSPTQHAGSSSPSDIESGLSQSNLSLPNLSQSGISNGRAPSSTIGSSSTYIGSSSSQIFNPLQTVPFARNKYLELCVNVNVGKYETKLAEIQITSSSAAGSTICTDAHLFRKIYERYFELRKYTWRRFLYRPAGIKFVHFGVQAGHRVGFFTGNPLPTEEVVASKRYEYNLQPPVPPPIDSRTFLHYFWKHSAHSGSTSARYVDRIPKKLGESLVRSLGTDELREGWGIHIIEGPNKAVICWMLLVVLGASFGVSLGYDMIMKVEDSGFAIGQWMVAALTVGLSALYFSLEDEVNTSFD